jgi:hypothetical protein
MTLGDLRQFLTSIDGIPDDAVVKARATWGRKLRSVTVEEDDVGFRDYLRAVGVDPGSIDVSDPDADPEVAFGTGVGLSAGMPSTSAGGSGTDGAGAEAGSGSGSGSSASRRSSKTKASSI